jgi:hypothetical protein
VLESAMQQALFRKRQEAPAAIPSPEPAMNELPSQPASVPTPTTAGTVLRAHWALYGYEGIELGLFMLAACLATVVLFGATSPMLHAVPSAALRRVLMGVAMGLTAIGIIHSPMGKRSGAHFNPAITLTYLRLGKIGGWDAVFYIVGQFVGGAAGVGASLLVAGRRLLAQPSVEYAVTVPGVGGTAGAFAAELFTATLLMGGLRAGPATWSVVSLPVTSSSSHRCPGSASTRRGRWPRRCLPGYGRRHGCTSWHHCWACSARRRCMSGCWTSRPYCVTATGMGCPKGFAGSPVRVGKRTSAFAIRPQRLHSRGADAHR